VERTRGFVTAGHSLPSLIIGSSLSRRVGYMTFACEAGAKYRLEGQEFDPDLTAFGSGFMVLRS
jgi:hypothetical protein